MIWQRAPDWTSLLEVLYMMVLSDNRLAGLLELITSHELSEFLQNY